jgi:hypothetical protein
MQHAICIDTTLLLHAQNGMWNRLNAALEPTITSIELKLLVANLAIKACGKQTHLWKNACSIMSAHVGP